jgi:hypothetical protein
MQLPYFERGHHLPLLFSVDQTVVVLHRDKWRELVIDRIVLHRVELVGVAARHPNISRISSLNDIMQSLHRLCNRCVGVKAVTLKDVDIVKLEPFKRVFDGFEDVLRLTNEVRIGWPRSRIKRTLRLRPYWLTRPAASRSAGEPPNVVPFAPYSLATGKKTWGLIRKMGGSSSQRYAL